MVSPILFDFYIIIKYSIPVRIISIVLTARYYGTSIPYAIAENIIEYSAFFFKIGFNLDIWKILVSFNIIERAIHNLIDITHLLLFNSIKEFGLKLKLTKKLKNWWKNGMS